MLTAGNTFNGSNRDFVLVRYNTDGSTDDTFSGDGLKITDFDSTDDFANAIILQNDGKILVGGSSAENFALARYNADGSFDTSFSGDGLQTTDFGHNDFIKKLALQSDGKILAGGSGLARYNTNGSIDGSFNFNFLECDGLAIQNDGKVLVTNQHDGFSLYRYNADGLPDYTFGDGGIVSFSDDADGAIEGSIAIQDDGKIVVGGSRKVNSHQEDRSTFVLVRFNTDGSRDITFNGGELVTNGGYESANAIQIQHDHKIILGGVSYSTGNFALRRYNAHGSLDTSFNGGFITTPVSSGYDEIADIAISGDKLYAVGHGQFPANYGVVARYLLNDKTLQLPTISLTTPVNHATYLSGGNVYLNAVASDADGTISKVEFYNGSTLLHTSSDTPYTFKWEHVRTGTYTLTARATDNSGLVTVSDTVHISVVPNTPPTVSIVNPANGQTFLTGATVHLQAAAADADGRIGKVEFYSDTTLLATEHKVPYTFNWKIGKPGSYIVTAKATDNWGAVTTSAAINISVLPNQPPAVSLITPANGKIFVAPATIELEAVAQDADGRIVQVSFYSDSVLLTGSEHKVPYTYEWQDVPAGTYTFTAIAKDNWSAETISAPVTITVLPSGEPALSSRSSLPNKAAPVEGLSVKVLPNPAVNILTINTTGFQKNERRIITIVSASGVVMKTVRLNKVTPMIQLEVSALPQGMYIVKINCLNNISYKQFIKL